MHNTEDRRKFSVIFPNVKEDSLKLPASKCLWSTIYSEGTVKTMGDLWHMSPKQIGRMQLVGRRSLYKCFDYFERNSMQDSLFNLATLEKETVVDEHHGYKKWLVFGIASGTSAAAVLLIADYIKDLI